MFTLLKQDGYKVLQNYVIMYQTKSELLNTNVSFYVNRYSSQPISVTVEEVLNRIASNYYEEQIKRIRFFKQKEKFEEANRIKNNLNAVTFCGNFEADRKASLCKFYNNILVIDIDKLSDEQMNETYKNLLEDSHVAAFWKSPSGNGWKGLIPINYINSHDIEVNIIDKHYYAFTQIEDYFRNEYNILLDKSGKDISRLCYMSWSPELVIKEKSPKFEVDLSGLQIKKKKEVRNLQTKVSLHKQPTTVNWNWLNHKEYRFVDVADNRFTIERIFKYLSKRHLSITETYENWVQVAFAVASSFHPTYGRKIFIRLCELDGVRHDEPASEKLLYDAYVKNENKVNFNTIIFLAKQKGYIIYT